MAGLIVDTAFVEKMLDYWRGKPNNPLNGKTFAEIAWLGKKYGIDLGGMKDVHIEK